MKENIFFICLILLIGCNTPSKIFVLDDIGKDKYYLTDSLQVLVKKRHHPPLIVINGRQFKYQQNTDTIQLPIKKKNISNITFLSKKTGMVLFGKSGKSGVLVITIAQADKSYVTDTTKNDKGL